MKRVLKQPSRFELMVDRFLESTVALLLAGSSVALFITWVVLTVITEG